MTDDLVCRVCDKEVPVKITGRVVAHPSQDTKGLCAGTDLEPKDPIL